MPPPTPPPQSQLANTRLWACLWQVIEGFRRLFISNGVGGRTTAPEPLGPCWGHPQSRCHASFVAMVKVVLGEKRSTDGDPPTSPVQPGLSRPAERTPHLCPLSHLPPGEKGTTPGRKAALPQSLGPGSADRPTFHPRRHRRGLVEGAAATPAARGRPLESWGIPSRTCSVPKIGA